MLGEESEPDRDDGDEAADVRRPPVPPLQRLARALEDDDDDVELVATPRLPSKPGKRARSAVQGRLDLGPTGASETPALTLPDPPKAPGRNRSPHRDALAKNDRLPATEPEDIGGRG